MSAINRDITSVHWHAVSLGDDIWRRHAARSAPAANGDVVAVMVFSAVGLLASLLFAAFSPGGLSALLAWMA